MTNRDHFIIKEDEVLEQLGLLDQFILQKKEGYRFTIDPILLAGFTEVKNEDQILDAGTGGGILPFLLYKNNRDKNIRITGVDIQPEYIDMAERSRKGNYLNNMTFMTADIRSIGKEYAGRYDLVITNPPFFKKKEGKISKNTEIALAKHELMIDFQTIIKKASQCLHQKGRFVFIHRSERFVEISMHLKAEGFCISRMQFIYPNANSGSKLFMAEAVKSSARQMTVMPPLIIYQEDGSYSPKVRELYG